MESLDLQRFTDVTCLLDTLQCSGKAITGAVRNNYDLDSEAVLKANFLQDIAWLLISESWDITTAVCLEEDLKDNGKFVIRVAYNNPRQSVYLSNKANQARERALNFLLKIAGSPESPTLYIDILGKVLEMKSGDVLGWLDNIRSTAPGEDQPFKGIKRWSLALIEGLSDASSPATYARLAGVMAKHIFSRRFESTNLQPKFLDNMANLQRIHDRVNSLVSFIDARVLNAELPGGIRFEIVKSPSLKEGEYETEGAVLAEIAPGGFKDIPELEEKLEAFSLACASTWERRCVHPEMQLVAFYDWQKSLSESKDSTGVTLQRAPTAPLIPYIGTSKPSCSCCQFIMKRRGFRNFSGSSTVDRQWTLPDMQHLNLRSADILSWYRDLAFLEARMIEQIKTCLKEYSTPALPEKLKASRSRPRADLSLDLDLDNLDLTGCEIDELLEGPVTPKANESASERTIANSEADGTEDAISEADTNLDNDFNAMTPTMESVFDINEVVERVEQQNVDDKSKPRQCSVGVQTQIADEIPRKNEFEDMLIAIRHIDEPWRHDLIDVKDICNSETREPDWNSFVNYFGPIDPNVTSSKLNFWIDHDALVIERRLVITKERQLRAALRWYLKQNKMHINAYVIPKATLKEWRTMLDTDFF